MQLLLFSLAICHVSPANAAHFCGHNDLVSWQVLQSFAQDLQPHGQQSLANMTCTLGICRMLALRPATYAVAWVL